MRQKYWTKIAEILPLHHGNIHLYDQSIHVINKDQWFRDFPKGSHLLSYLYNILISLESDLSVINLVRKLFQQTLKPYLNFITSFIYEGDFNDPFDEFYIEKLQQDQGDSEFKPADPHDKYKISDKQKFKIKGGNLAGIPIFLTGFTLQIFKCGSTLSLLKEVQDGQYFSIWCSDMVRLELPSPYDMRSLNEHCTKLSKFYTNQWEKLVDMENVITQDEMHQQEVQRKIRQNYANWLKASKV